MFSIDFSLAYRQAQEMEQCANEMNALGTKLERTTSSLRGEWKGEVSLAFQKKLEAFSSGLKNDSEKCRNDAAAFRAQIDEMKKMEEELAKALSASPECGG